MPQSEQATKRNKRPKITGNNQPPTCQTADRKRTYAEIVKLSTDIKKPNVEPTKLQATRDTRETTYADVVKTNAKTIEKSPSKKPLKSSMQRLTGNEENRQQLKAITKTSREEQNSIAQSDIPRVTSNGESVENKNENGKPRTNSENKPRTKRTLNWNQIECVQYILH